MLVCALITFAANLEAQVYTRILHPSEQIVDYIPWHIAEKPDAKLLAPPDVDATLAQDAVNNPINRIAIGRKTRLSPEDGTFYHFGNYSIWKLTAQSSGATYLNFDFSNLTLPEGSAMIIYSDANRMIHGPITAKQYREQRYTSDVVAGEEATIEVFLPENTVKLFDFTMNKFYYGIVPTMGGPNTKAYGAAAVCIPDISCPEGAQWQLQADATCVILNDEERENCTGTLVTDQCRTGTPFILTANHCIGGLLTNPADLGFRFNYRNIACGNTSGPSTFLYVTFNGATSRATFPDSDGALLELVQDISQIEGLAFAGWDRRNILPTEGTIIHHPAGDAMKITHDSDPPDLNVSNINLTNSNGVVTIVMPPANALVLELLDSPNDFGHVEPGSSGSADLNQDQRIVGVLAGGTSATCNQASSAFYGRFSSFWVGNGGNNNSLEPWLSDMNAPLFTDGHYATQISGEDAVCSNDQYELRDFFPGSTVSWEVTPTNLFSGATSGVGAIATLSAQNINFPGSAVITFTVINGNCGTRTFSRDLWVGKPAVPVIQLPSCFTPGLNYSLSATAQGATGFSWSFPNCSNLPPYNSDPCWLNYTGNLPSVFVNAGAQSGAISVFATNRCGTRSSHRRIHFCDDGGGGGGIIIKSANALDSQKVVPTKLTAFPNPLKKANRFRLQLDGRSTKDKLTAPVHVSILDLNGKVVTELRDHVVEESISLHLLPAGIYLIKVTVAGIPHVTKITKL